MLSSLLPQLSKQMQMISILSIVSATKMKHLTQQLAQALSMTDISSAITTLRLKLGEATSLLPKFQRTFGREDS